MGRGCWTAAAALGKETSEIMATKNKGKGQVVVVAKQLIAATGKHLSNTTPVAFAGGSFTADQITSKLQSLVDLRSNVNAAKAAAKAKLATEATQAPALRSFTRALRSFVKVSFSTSPDVLADFGINLKVREPLSVEAKAAAVAKRAATRAARHTMGSRQKEGVKGDVTGVVVTPIAAASTTVTPPSSPTAPATRGGTTAAATPRTA
jgi:hypothetical protein